MSWCVNYELQTSKVDTLKNKQRYAISPGLARFPGPGHKIKLSFLLQVFILIVSLDRFLSPCFIWFPGPGVAKALSRVFQLLGFHALHCISLKRRSFQNIIARWTVKPWICQIWFYDTQKLPSEVDSYRWVAENSTINVPGIQTF